MKCVHVVWIMLPSVYNLPPTPLIHSLSHSLSLLPCPNASLFSTHYSPFHLSVDTCLHTFCLQVGGLTSAVCAWAVPPPGTALMTCVIILSFAIVNNSSFPCSFSCSCHWGTINGLLTIAVVIFKCKSEIIFPLEYNIDYIATHNSGARTLLQLIVGRLWRPIS